MKEHPITRGFVVTVDDSDYQFVAAHKWQPVVERGHVRGVQRVAYLGGGRENQQRKTIKLHRELLGVTDPRVTVDHIDGNPLNNCRANLRLATRAQNAANKAGYMRRKSGYLGVCFCKRTGRWAANIKAGGKAYFLGRHPSPEIAAAAYNEAARRLFGEFASLNEVAS